MNLWDEIPGTRQEIAPDITYYPSPCKKSDGAIIIFPGGGYVGRAAHEGKGYAEFFNQNGMDAFVVDYRISPNRFPLPLLDARRAVRWVRYHCEEFGICPHKIAVMGSSAGGHLTALLSTYREKIEFEEIDDIDKISYLPDFQILCYPVISMTDLSITHVGSVFHLLGEEQLCLAKTVSPELIADSQTPPAFIWHTFEDNAVSVNNSLLYAKKLKELEIPTELHIFPDGCHGLGLSESVPHTAQWTGLLLNWLKKCGF